MPKDYITRAEFNAAIYGLDTKIQGLNQKIDSNYDNLSNLIKSSIQESAREQREYYNQEHARHIEALVEDFYHNIQAMLEMKK